MSRPHPYPQHWALARLGDIVDVVRGASPRPKGDPRYFGGDIPWISIRDVTQSGGPYLRKTREGVTTAGAERSRLLKSGTLILSNSATVCVPKILAVDGCIHDGFVAFPDLPTTIDPLYLFDYFNWIRPEILRKHRQGITQVNLNTGIVSDFEIRLPPFSEQQRIVTAIDSYFTRLDDAVASLHRVQRNLKRYRASVLKAAVEGRLVPTEAELARAEGRSYEPASVLLERILAERRRYWEEVELAKMKARGKAPKDDRWKARYVEPVPPDTSELPELPEGWSWTSCAQVLLRLQTGPFGSTLHKSDYVSGGTPIINPQHLRDSGIHPSENVGVGPETLARLSGFALAVGDVVLGRRGEMGRCALVGEREQGWLLGTGSLALKLAKSIDRQFVTWVMRSPRTVRTLEGESVGTTMTNLNQEILFGLPIPLPPAAEQVRIVQEIARFFSIIEVVESTTTAQIERCSRFRQSILKWAFEGRLVNQDPSDEPASVLLDRICAERAADGGDASARRRSRSSQRSPSRRIL